MHRLEGHRLSQRRQKAVAHWSTVDPFTIKREKRWKRKHRNTKEIPP